MELALDDSINMSNDNNRGGGRSRRGRSFGGRGGGFLVVSVAAFLSTSTMA